MKYKNNELVAWIDITTHCNAGCPQCHRTNPNSLKKVDWLPLVQWSLKDFIKTFTPVDMMKIKKFELCGTWGDPIMNKDVKEIVKYIIENSNCYIQINTNGGIRDEGWWWELGVIGRKRLEVYFDIEGITQEMHSKYRQKVNLEKLKENIHAYVGTGATANAHVIAFKHNEDYLYDIVNMIDNELGIKGDIIIQTSNRWDEYHKKMTYTYKGKEITIEEVTNKNHPLLQDIAPIRDRINRNDFNLPINTKLNQYTKRTDRLTNDGVITVLVKK